MGWQGCQGSSSQDMEIVPNDQWSPASRGGTSNAANLSLEEEVCRGDEQAWLVDFECFRSSHEDCA